MKDDEPDDIRRLDDVRVLAALGNPVRARLMDALAVHGASTTSFLATALGIATGSVSHHLRVLVDVGLVRAAPETAVDKRERRWALVTRGWGWSPADFSGHPTAEAAAVSAEGAMLARQFEQARHWIETAEAPWDGAAFAGHHWLRLSVDELVELGHQLEELMVGWRRRDVPDDGVERRTILGVVRVFPAEP